MRITLVYPSVGRKEHTTLRARLADAAAIDGAAAGLTPADVEVRFYDDRMEEIPFDEPTDLVAMSVETFTTLRAYKIARQYGPAACRSSWAVTTSRSCRTRRRTRPTRSSSASRAGLGRDAGGRPPRGVATRYDGLGRRR